jgi:hypothetical protein
MTLARCSGRLSLWNKLLILSLVSSFSTFNTLLLNLPVFIIRFAERRIDQLLDAALLENAPLSSELDGVQFESEWSFLRPFSAKKKSSTTVTPTSSTPLRNGMPSSPPFLPIRPPSPSINLNSPSPLTPKALSSLRQTLSRARTPVHAVFAETSPSKGLRELISFLTALHTLLILSDVNPVLIIQFWSQVMYWTSSESARFSVVRWPTLRRRNIQPCSNPEEISMPVRVFDPAYMCFLSPEDLEPSKSV